MTKIKKSISCLSQVDRRQIISYLSSAVASRWLSRTAKVGIAEIIAGSAMAESLADKKPTYFVEVNLRDQWDFGHVWVPNGLATNSGLIRGDSGQKAALFYAANELIPTNYNCFLTGDSATLAPHMDSVAVFDLCELSMGPIHGHEAAGASRSPGRSYNGGPGRAPMWLKDPATSDGGNAFHYSATPTPACLHNYSQKILTPELANGFVFKGVGRPDHTVYHFEGNLNGGDLDRFQRSADLIQGFALRSGNLLSTKTQADALIAAVKQLDRRNLLQFGFSNNSVDKHDQELNALRGLLHSSNPHPVDLILSAEDRNIWNHDVPQQVASKPSIPIGEQFAYITRLFQSGLVRTAAVEFGYLDIHGGRNESQVRSMAKQIAIPLARFISALKQAGLYDQTLIAVYSTDGGRSPAADSYGDSGKNTTVLAGGMIRGGYYGDIQVAGPYADGNRYRYHRPDSKSGQPISNGSLGNDQRVRGAEIWQTVGAALKVPDEILKNFPDAAAEPLSFALRS